MIRTAIATIVRRLTTDPDAIRLRMDRELKEAVANMWRLRGQLDDTNQAVDELREENARLRAMAGNTDPTKSEAEMLAIVRMVPGLLVQQYGKMCAEAIARTALAADASNQWAAYVIKNGPTRGCIDNAGKHLVSLHTKGLVRREKAGQSYRYWVTE